MAQQTFLKQFVDYDAAFDYQNKKNMAFKKAGNMDDLFCVVPGPEDGYAVVDSRTAIELEMGYVFSASSTAYVDNPWQ